MRLLIVNASSKPTPSGPEVTQIEIAAAVASRFGVEPADVESVLTKLAADRLRRYYHMVNLDAYSARTILAEYGVKV